MASLKLLLLFLIHLYIIVRGGTTTCTDSGKTIYKCDWSKWSQWNCSLCVTQYETKRQRGLCCPSSSVLPTEKCFSDCGFIMKDSEESGHFPLHCPGYTDSTTIKTTTKTATLPSNSISTTFITNLPNVKTVANPTSSLVTVLSKTSINPPTLLTFGQSTSAISKSDTSGDDRISICVSQCASSENKDDCIVECMGDKFTKFCQILSISLFFVGLILGLIITAVVNGIKQKREAKSSRLVTPERVRKLSNINYQTSMNHNSENHITKCQNSKLNIPVYKDKSNTSPSIRLPIQSPRCNQRLSTCIPRNKPLPNKRTNHINEDAWTKENEFKSEPRVELEYLEEMSRAELDEHFDAGSDMPSRLHTTTTRRSAIGTHRSDIGTRSSSIRTASSVRPEFQRIRMLYDAA